MQYPNVSTVHHKVTGKGDAETYPRTEIIALYLKRWNVELDFDAIKTTMKMDMLRCKSPEMVRKEICINLLVFNLIKSLMGRTAQYIGKKPREISFKTAQETLVSFHQTLLMAPVDSLERKVNSMLKIISQHIVANRPGRSEPRAVKRRPKPHQRLEHSRSQARRLNKYKGWGLKSVPLGFRLASPIFNCLLNQANSILSIRERD